MVADVWEQASLTLAEEKSLMGVSHNSVCTELSHRPPSFLAQQWSECQTIPPPAISIRHNAPFHQRMALAQELIPFRGDGANLAVCTAPLPSNLAKHNSNGKNLLRSESQVQTKLEEPGAAAPTPVTCHYRMRGPHAVLDAILQVRLSLHLS